MDLKPTRKKAMLHRMCFTQNKNIRHLSRIHRPQVVIMQIPYLLNYRSMHTISVI